MNNNTAGENKRLNDENLTTNTAQTAAADNDNGATEFGKFKDAKSLLNAYNALLSEFTRRCQKVKALEREKEFLSREKNLNVSSENPLGDEVGEEYADKSKLKNVSAEFFDDSKLREEKLNADNNFSCNLSYDELKNKIIREYLDSVSSLKPSVTLTTGNGGAIVAPPYKPKTISEAGELAVKILNDKEIY